MKYFIPISTYNILRKETLLCFWNILEHDHRCSSVFYYPFIIGKIECNSLWTLHILQKHVSTPTQCCHILGKLQQCHKSKAILPDQHIKRKGKKEKTSINSKGSNFQVHNRIKWIKITKNSSLINHQSGSGFSPIVARQRATLTDTSKDRVKGEFWLQTDVCLKASIRGQNNKIYNTTRTNVYIESTVRKWYGPITKHEVERHKSK